MSNNNYAANGNNTIIGDIHSNGDLFWIMKDSITAEKFIEDIKVLPKKEREDKISLLNEVMLNNDILFRDIILLLMDEKKINEELVINTLLKKNNLLDSRWINVCIEKILNNNGLSIIEKIIDEKGDLLRDFIINKSLSKNNFEIFKCVINKYVKNNENEAKENCIKLSSRFIKINDVFFIYLLREKNWEISKDVMNFLSWENNIDAKKIIDKINLERDLKSNIVINNICIKQNKI